MKKVDPAQQVHELMNRLNGKLNEDTAAQSAEGDKTPVYGDKGQALVSQDEANQLLDKARELIRLLNKHGLTYVISMDVTLDSDPNTLLSLNAYEVDKHTSKPIQALIDVIDPLLFVFGFSPTSGKKVRL